MPPQPRRATIGDIARRAGVSKGAVSFALNDRPGVSAETRQRILAIAQELNWRPNSAAQALGQSRAGVIGFVLNRPARILGTETFFPELLSGIQLGLSPAHTALHMLVVSSLEEEVETYREWWHAHRVDGVIVVDPRANDPRLALLDELGLPGVLIGSHPSRDTSVPTVWVDDSEAARTLFGYLAALGHRRLAHVAGTAEFEHTLLRSEVLQSFVGQFSLESATSTPTDYSAEAAASETRRLLSLPERPTAIVYDNDVMALAGLRVAHEMGIAVPGSLSIASFDDSLMVRLVRPSITTLTRDTVELGEVAVRTLLDALDATAPVPSRPGPAPQLSVRESTAPPPRA
ncbi:LacI family DNA-binding transcriptional regulator [Gryllotalpicola kribbensis]|jgi:DNA-binding LacI/PurR family transcriptional regulator|uniref:LacI family DNA-binding transcriptional regulator n=1 Tax=Gryllotalpicola kribbensis TaxID=993084 RepID=A0ABP8AHA8_9MICO